MFAKPFHFRLATLALVLGVLFCPISAFATLLTFDNTGGSLPNGYGGVDWSGIFVLDASTYPIVPSGYLNGLVSGNYDTASVGGSMDSSTPFDLDSGYFTAGWNNNLVLNIAGYNASGEVYSNDYTLQATGPSFLTLNYDGVTDVTFTVVSPGTSAGYSGAGGWFSMDNLTVNGSPAAAPDGGATVALLGLGLAVIATQRRRLARS